MRNPLKYLLLAGILLTLSHSIQAGPTVAEAIARAERFSYDTLGRLVMNASVSGQWLKGDRYFHYHLEDSSDCTRHFIVDAKTWKKKPLFDTEALTAALDSILDTRRGGVRSKSTSDRPGQYDIWSIEFPDGRPDTFVFRYDGRRFKYDTSGNILEEIPDAGAAPAIGSNKEWYKSYSADSLYYIAAIGHDLVLYSDHGRDSVLLTSDGEQWYSYAVGGDSEKKPDSRSGAIGLWVGSSHKYFMVREDKRRVGTLTLVNSLARPRPVAKTWKYAMPGDSNVVRYEAYLADADRGTISRIPVEAWPDQRISVPRFNRFFHTDSHVYFIRLSRPSDIVDLCRVDVRDGSMKVLISENCSPHLNEQLFSYHILDGGKEILWWSERSGKGMYYLYDGEGRLKNPVTPEDMVAGNIVRISDEDREIIFEGYGHEPGVNPYYKFYYRASLDGRGKTVCLTPGNGDHDAVISPEGRYVVDNMSRMDLAPQHRIFDMKGRERMRLEDADISRLYARGWKEPLVMKLHAADSVTDLYGVVYLPFDLDTTKKYPVISSVYPGPQIDLVPTSFIPDDNYNQSLAQMGFVVINFAYRGSSPFRGRDFQSFGYGNLRDYPLDDDYAVIRQIGDIFPFADTTRVGIYGHSGGGFMTATAMMTRPDFYKAGVAASGNYDNNIYMQWWGETFHGVRQETDRTGRTDFSCDIPTTMELAAKLKGSLLLITGDMDNNVHPASTMRLADALIKAGKFFDMMIIPGADHGVGGKYYVDLIRLYFAGHLLGMDTDHIN